MIKRFFVFAVMAATVVLAGCVATAPAKKTSLEIQAIQAKSVETTKAIAFNSTMSVLQDLGYIIGSASIDTGFITAESPVEQDQSANAVLNQIFGGVRTEQRTAVTATVEGIKENLTRIRLNFVVRQKRSGAYGQNASDDKPVEDVKVYQNAFEKIQEAIFIRKGSS
jgi:ABC-type phosphate/phosphonate transport system substrate-binding protein